MNKAKLNELLKYTKSKKILRVILLYNNEEILNQVISIYENLYNSNRTDSEKSELVMLYLKYRKKKDHMSYLVSNSLINKEYTFTEQEKLINKYITNKIKYEDIINECYVRSMNEHLENDKQKEENNIRYVKPSSTFITSNKNVLKYRSNEEIYNLIKVYYKDKTGILLNLIINEDVLQNRNNYEHIKMLNLYLDYPYTNIFNILVNSKILEKTSLEEQFKLVDIFLENPTNSTFYKIIEMINNNHSVDKIDRQIQKEIKKEIKVYKKTNERK